jgi:hypothetical protein
MAGDGPATTISCGEIRQVMARFAPGAQCRCDQQGSEPVEVVAALSDVKTSIMFSSTVAVV